MNASFLKFFSGAKANKKPRPRYNCWDRESTCGATRLGANRIAPTSIAHNHVHHFANGDATPACLPEILPGSARPRKPIRLSSFCRDPTIRSSLKVGIPRLLTLSQRFGITLSHKSKKVNGNFHTFFRQSLRRLWDCKCFLHLFFDRSHLPPERTST